MSARCPRNRPGRYESNLLDSVATTGWSTPSCSMVKSVSDDQPRVGFYQIRKVKGGPVCGARVWMPCVCTVNGGDAQVEHTWRPTCDRPKMILAEIDGQPADPVKVTLFGERVNEGRYRYLLAARPYSGAADKVMKKDKIDPRRFAP